MFLLWFVGWVDLFVCHDRITQTL